MSDDSHSSTNPSDDSSDELQVQIQYALVERLTSSQRRQAKLLELLDECIFECDEQFNLSYVNLAWTRQLGYAPEALLGVSLCDFLAEAKSSAEFEECFAELQAGRSVELELLDSQQRRHWFELRLTANDQDGYIGSLFNIQQHKDMEVQLKEQQEYAHRLALVASHTNNMVVITDRKGRIEWVNQSFETRTGYSTAEVIGRQPGAFLQGPDTDQDTVEKMSVAIRQGRAFQVEILNYDRSNKPYWVAIDVSPVLDETGNAIRFIAIETDITQRVLAEQAVAESEYNYRSVVDHIPDVVLRMLPHGELVFINQAWRRMVGADEDSCMGACITDFMDAADSAEVERALAEYRGGRRSSMRLDLRMAHRAGNHTWVEMTMTPVLGGARGALTAIAATLVDVDERVSTAIALKQAKLHAESLALAKSRFMANISHEIRTPLNAVLGAADILRDTGLNREQLRFTDMIKTSGDALLSILDDVLTYSRFEAGGITIEQNHFHLDACLEEAIDIVSDDAVHKGLALILDIAPDVPLEVIGDKVRLRQVMINLLTNAIKFTPQGQILARARTLVRAPSVAAHSADYYLEINVEDTGIGIAADKCEQMFQPFIQSDTSTTRQFGGSGLGLAICRQICDAAGGSIQVESEPGVGTRFTVVLPLSLPPQQNISALPLLAPELQPVIWVLGARSALNEALVHMLARYNLSCKVFTRVDQLPKVSAKPFDVLIATDPADVALCRAYIKPFTVPDKTPCILTLDLCGRGRLQQTGQESELLLNGPFKLSHFLRGLEAMEDLLVDVQLYHPLVLDARNKAVTPHSGYLGNCVMVVEDNKHNQVIATQFLQQRGCRVVVAEDGAMALKVLRNQKVDLILMDIQMPVMDGLTATQHIRASVDDFAQIPIIAATANAIHGDRERFLAAGMNDYLTKPIARSELNRLLDLYLEPELPKLDGETLLVEELPDAGPSKYERLRLAHTQLQAFIKN